MNSKVKPTFTPRLRFPEFQADWSNDSLCKVLREEKLKNIDGRDVFSVSLERGIVNQIEHLGRSYAANDTSHYSKAKPYDLAYTKSPLRDFPFGIVKQSKFPTEVALSPLYGVFTPINRYLGLLVEAYFESPHRSKAFLSPLCQKGAKNTIQITNSTFLSGRMPLPKEEAEQRKIAECLNSLDVVITAHSQKLYTLKALKKGLMQYLVPQGGETVPRYRFPKFQNAPNWRLIHLGDLLSRKPEYGVNAPAAPYSKKLPTYLRITDIDDDGQFIGDSKASVDIIAAENNYLSMGDIVLARTGASVGKSYRYRMQDGELVFAGFLIRIRPEPQKVDSVFLSHCFTTKQYWDWVGITSARSGQPGINGVEYASLPIPLPPNEATGDGISEQHKIAECVASLGDLIALQVEKMDALKIHKNGLMQQLFPSTEEVQA